MTQVKNFLLTLVGLILGMITTVLTLIHGWGLEPQSWVWIIGLSLLGQTIAVFFVIIAREREN